MKSKKFLEIENPKMYKGQVMFIAGNPDGDKDEQFIKIAHHDGRFNDFEYGLPFGVKTEMVEIVPEQTITDGSDNGGFWGYYANSSIQPFEVETDKEYIVKLDGTEYNLVSRTFERDWGTVNEIGDSSLTDVPFFIGVESGYPYIGVATGGDHTISIITEREIIQPLQARFVEKTVLYGDVYKGEYLYHDFGCTKKVTNTELKDIVKNSASIMISYYYQGVGIEYCIPFCIFPGYDYGEVMFYVLNGETERLYTAEYESQNGGGGAPV